MVKKVQREEVKTTPVSEVRFFHRLSKPLRCFINMKKPRKDKKDKRQVPITFRMPLDGYVVRSAPDIVQHAYTGVAEFGQKSVNLRKAIDGVDIKVYELPENKRVLTSLGSLLIENLEVAEYDSPQGDTAIVLTFETLYPWDTDTWRFLGRYYASDVFLKFDSAQASLLDLPEALEDEEPEVAQASLPTMPGGKDTADGAKAE